MTSGKHSGGRTSPFFNPQRSVYILVRAEGSTAARPALVSFRTGSNESRSTVTSYQRCDAKMRHMMEENAFSMFCEPAFPGRGRLSWKSLSRPLSSSPYKPSHCMRDDLLQKPPMYHGAVSLQIPRGFSQSAPQSLPWTDFRL